MSGVRHVTLFLGICLINGLSDDTDAASSVARELDLERRRWWQHHLIIGGGLLDINDILLVVLDLEADFLVEYALTEEDSDVSQLFYQPLDIKVMLKSLRAALPQPVEAEASWGLIGAAASD